MPLPTFAPVSGPRIGLRPVEAHDLAALLLVNGDPEVTRFLPYDTWQGPADAEAWLARMARLAEGGTAQQLVMVDAAEGLAIGTLLLFRFEEASARLEIGYTLARRCWGRGLAREAIALALSWGVAQAGIRRFEAEVNPANTASNRLLAALGFTHEGTLRERWTAKGTSYDVNVWGLLAREWPAAA